MAYILLHWFPLLPGANPLQERRTGTARTRKNKNMILPSCQKPKRLLKNSLTGPWWDRSMTCRFRSMSGKFFSSLLVGYARGLRPYQA